MNQRTRYFLIGSAFVVVVGLCTGIVAYYGGNLSAGRGAYADLGYLPPDATAVAYADVQDIMKSGFSQKIRTLLPTGADKDRLTSEIGVDLERDIDSVTASMSGSGPEGGVVLLRGRFDLAKIEALTIQHGGSVSDYQGKKLLHGSQASSDPAMGRNGGPGLSTPGVAVLETNLLALGPIPALHRVIDTASTNQDITDNPELMKFIGDVRQKGNAWVVGRLDAVSAAPGLPDQLRAQLPSVQWFAVSADVDQAITGSLRAQTVDAKSGDDLRKMLNGAIAAARVFGGSNPTLLSALNSMQASGQGPNVEVSFTLTAELLEQLHGGALGAPGAGRGSDPTRIPPGLK